MDKIIIQMDKTVISDDNQPNVNMVSMARGLHENGGKVIFMTMTCESERTSLYQWILKYMGKMFENVPLYMPRDDDDRDEKEIVADWLRDIRNNKQNVYTVIDGREGKSEMWLGHGLACCEFHSEAKK